MLKEDKDINIDGDTLNRSNFAENLSLNIQNYFNRSNNCLTIGLMGEWGSGKTSILNMTEDYLKDSKIIIFLIFHFIKITRMKLLNFSFIGQNIIQILIFLHKKVF